MTGRAMWLSRTLTTAALAAAALGSAAAAPRAGALAAQQASPPTRVLLLFQQQAETPSMLEFAEQLQATVRRELGVPVEFYQEALDFDRFAQLERVASLTNYFDAKYRGAGIDVVVPVGSRALRYAVDQLRGVLAGVPIVFALNAAPQTDPATLPAHVTGRLASPWRFASTLAMARRLQPDARQIVAVGGAGAGDSSAVAAVRRAAVGTGDSLPLVVLQGLPLSDLLPALRRLPRQSIVIFANFRTNAVGQAFDPIDIIGSLARAASAPMYAQLSTYVGHGVVGGSVLRFDEEGALTGRLVARVLRRAPGSPLPPVETIENSYVVDWRELVRWGMSAAALPPGTQLLFREPTAWERYRAVVLLALGLVLVQAALIGTLLVERRRRKRAQVLADEQQRRAEETRQQVTHMGRVALVGEMAATIAHELRQPLAAIRANAEIGEKLASREWQLGGEEQELLREIFADIVRDDVQAADIVTRVRALLRREELPQQPVDLNEVCRTTERLLHHEAQMRRAKLVLALAPEVPPVRGDPVQLQQLVLNLAVNALDAAGASPDPRVVIGTAARGSDVEVTIRDNGPGIPPGVRDRMFEAFFTTKSHGLGLGLVIVQSIIERHHGRVRAESGEAGGAVLRVTVPRARGVQSQTSLAGMDRVQSASAVPA